MVAPGRAAGGALPSAVVASCRGGGAVFPAHRGRPTSSRPRPPLPTIHAAGQCRPDGPVLAHQTWGTDSVGLMDRLRGELIDIIEWTDDTRRHDRVAVPAARERDQDERQARGARGPDGGVRQRGHHRRRVRARHLHPGDAEPAGPVDAEGVEVRLREPVQGRGLLRLDAAVHRPEVGHPEPRDDARPRVRDGAGPGVRHLRLPRGRPRRAAARAGRHRPRVHHRRGGRVHPRSRSSPASSARWPPPVSPSWTWRRTRTRSPSGSPESSARTCATWAWPCRAS